MENRYPRVEINLDHLQQNVSRVVERCGSFGIQVAGVIKGATGLPEVAKAFDKGGAAFIASSRLEQLEDAIYAGIEKPMMLIRIPMLSEVKDVVRLADISLNSVDFPAPLIPTRPNTDPSPMSSPTSFNTAVFPYMEFMKVKAKRNYATS